MTSIGTPIKKTRQKQAQKPVVLRKWAAPSKWSPCDLKYGLSHCFTYQACPLNFVSKFQRKTLVSHVSVWLSSNIEWYHKISKFSSNKLQIIQNLKPLLIRAYEACPQILSNNFHREVCRSRRGRESDSKIRILDKIMDFEQTKSDQPKIWNLTSCYLNKIVQKNFLQVQSKNLLSFSVWIQFWVLAMVRNTNM